MAVMSGFKGTKSTRVLRFLEKVVKNDPDPSVKSAAVRILNKAGIKKFAVFALFEKLGSSDDGVVMDAISKLAKEDKPEVAMALIDVMPHRNAQVRKMAMSTIVALNNIEALLKIMGSDRIEMNFRNEAAGILAKGDDDNGNTALAHLMDNGNTELVINTTVTVAKRRRYRLVGRVITNLGHADSGIRAASSKALATIKDSKALTPLAAAVRADRENSKLHEKAVLAILGDLSREEVIKRSGDKDTLIRQLAIKTLFKFTEAGRPHPSVLRVLKQRLGDSDKDIRRSAAFALARIKDAGVVRSLVKLIADPDGAIRAQVAVALSASKHPRADTLLMQLMADSNPPTKRAAIDGLRQRGFKAVLQKLRFLANHRTPEVRRAVMQAIFELAGPEGWDKWFDIWQGALFDLDPQVKIWAAKGISQRRDPRVPGLLDALVMDRNGAVQIAALEGLGKSGQPSAIEYIAKGLMDIKRDVKIAALDALKSLNLEGGKIPIREFVKNEADKVLVSKANDIYDALP
jgi:HEAT repeat protein